MATEYKLSYTASEIDEKLGKIDDLATKSEVPTKTSDLTNDSGFLTSVPDEYVTETELSSKGYLTEHQDLSSYALKTEIPTVVSDLQNDSGFITGYTETDPTVPAWAKASTKPTYTASEVGADVAGTASSLISAHNEATDAHGDIREIVNNLSLEIADKEQLTPEFANSIEECTDTTKLYVLPDGYIYAYMLTEVVSGPSYTNLLPTSTEKDRTTIFNGTGYKTGVRLSGSSGAESDSSNNKNQGISGFISASVGQVLRIKNIDDASRVANYVIAYNASNTPTGNVQNPTVSNNSLQVTLTESQFGSGFNAVRLSFNGLDAETIVTLDEEINEGGGTTTDYAWVSTGHAFVPADYEDRIVVLENEVDALKEAVADGVASVDKSTMFIAPDGNDSNDGLTESTPKKTVKACVNAGAKRISAKRGVYNEIIALYDITELEIFPTDNDLTHEVGVERQPVVFDTSDSVEVSSLTAYNSIKRVSYSNSANTQFDKVFTKRSQPPIYGGSEYGSRYNATVWLLSEDESTVCIKLKPVLTVAECESEANTFTYVDGYIYINADMTSVAKVIVPTNWNCGIRIDGADRFVLKEVEVRFAGSYNIDIRNCAHFDFYKCACKYTSYGSGFHPYNSNGLMTACYATKNYDGYGISGYGHTTYIDCVSEFNFDDGMSHHNATEGTVIGGRYEGNGKGGITPAYGAKVNIYGGLYKNNASFGIGYLWAADLEPASGMVQGAVMVGNPVGLSVQKNCDVTAVDCIYQGNSSNKDIKGNFTEINNSYTSGGNGGNEDSGNDGSGTASSAVSAHNSDGMAHSDIREQISQLSSEIADKMQLAPEFANNIDECTDTTKLYVLPDGFIYAWMLTEKEVVSGSAYTNLLPLAKATDRTTIYNGKGYKENTKLSGSGGGESAAGTGKEAMCTSGFIFPVVAGDILRIKGIAPVSGSNHYVVGYDSSNTRTGNDPIVYSNHSDGSLYWITEFSSGKYTIENNDEDNPKGATIVYTINTAKLGANVNAVRICAAMDENTIVTLNEEIKEGGGTEIVTEYAWANTGLAFVPADYEDRILDLETKSAQNTADIAELKEGKVNVTAIKTWDAPIYDANIPIFQLSSEKAAITESEKTVSAVYAKYDALMARHPHYITKTDLGMCSDGVTPVYRYDFHEPEPHRGTTGKKEWSETKAKAIIVSGIHWEWGGIFSLYNALEELADNPDLFHLRRNTHLIVLPVCNPYAVANMSVRNANLVEIHRNFEVDFIYPGEAGYIELGERSHGGTAPLSEVETQYMDNIMKANTDAAFFLTCHSNQSDTVYGTGFTWASPATYYMCNMHYRLVDKLSNVWMKKYGDELAAGIADYRTENTPEWDNRLGSAYLSTTNGTETKQATKYGIQATNIEVTDAFLAHGTKANPEPALSSFTMSRGAEVYVNFLLTAFGTYDPKDKALYR